MGRFRLLRVGFKGCLNFLTRLEYVPRSRVLLHPKYLLIHVDLYIFVFVVVYVLLSQWPGMVYFHPRGNFVDYDFLEASYLAIVLQHVSPLAMEALPSNSPLHMLPIQRHKFSIKRTEVRIHVNICRCSIKSYFI